MLMKLQGILKWCLKMKIRYTKSLVITFLMMGIFSYSANVWIDNNKVSGGLNNSTTVFCYKE